MTPVEASAGEFFVVLETQVLARLGSISKHYKYDCKIKCSSFEVEQETRPNTTAIANTIFFMFLSIIVSGVKLQSFSDAIHTRECNNATVLITTLKMMSNYTKMNQRIIYPVFINGIRYIVCDINQRPVGIAHSNSYSGLPDN